MHHRLFGISRHRIGVDGEGVTSLVAYRGCPLRCRYCINREPMEDDALRRTLSTERLIAELAKDDLYFRATGGGVTFGGGEPLLQPDCLAQVRRLCPPYWKINVETSLNVPAASVEPLVGVVDHWIVDIKDINPDIYRAYTGKDNRDVVGNLKTLVEAGARITARVPHIPGYNTPDDVAHSIALLKEMGVTEIDEFTYIINNDGEQ